MEPQLFNEIFDQTINQITQTVKAKEKEYSDGKDRLVQFKRAAAMRHGAAATPGKTLDALVGMMIKHTSSIFEMLEGTIADTESYPLITWDEKINDQIIYLILMKGMLIENGMSDDF